MKPFDICAILQWVGGGAKRYVKVRVGEFLFSVRVA